jgi:hypothetical protein
MPTTSEMTDEAQRALAIQLRELAAWVEGDKPIMVETSRGLQSALQFVEVRIEWPAFRTLGISQELALQAEEDGAQRYWPDSPD